MTSIKHVILDWNGTLLDDLDLAVSAVNHVSSKFGRQKINREIYRRHFDFPISRFYDALGFDFNVIPFVDIIQEYLSIFDANVHDCRLHAGATEFLECMVDRGIELSILSASHADTLMTGIRHKGLERYFVQVYGLQDQVAKSKLQQAYALQSCLDVKAHEILYIGDTLHDDDIANELGWSKCILTCGHQSPDRLSGCELIADSFAHFRQVAAWPGDLPHTQIVQLSLS